MILCNEPIAELTQIASLKDCAFDPASAALLVAHINRPDLKLAAYCRHLKKMADDLHKYVNNDPMSANLNLRVEALTQVVIRRYGYKGKNGIELDPDGADLSRVIDARSGSSEALAIIMLNLTKSLKWPAKALSLPGRVLVRLESLGERQIIDPFAGEAHVNPQYLRRMTSGTNEINATFQISDLEELENRTLLMRLLTLQQSLLLRDNRLPDALKSIEASLLISPENSRLWTEYGMLYARLNKVKPAVNAFEKALSFAKAEENRYKISMLLQKLRTKT